MWFQSGWHTNVGTYEKSRVKIHVFLGIFCFFWGGVMHVRRHGKVFEICAANPPPPPFGRMGQKKKGGGGGLAAQISKISQCLRTCITTPPKKKSLGTHGFSPYFFHMFQNLYTILTESTFSPHIFDKFQGFSEGKCGFIGENPKQSTPGGRDVLTAQISG